MAGSYGHVRPVLHGEDENERPYRGSWSLIENMGDAYECVEQLLWLALYFASLTTSHQTLDQADEAIMNTLNDVYYPMRRSEKPSDEFLKAVNLVMNDDMAPLAVDAIAARKAAQSVFETAEKKAEEKIRAIVRSELEVFRREIEHG